MANPQLEDGYTKIVNQILDKLIEWHFSGQELRIVLLIIRKTWGFNKKEDAVSLSQMMSMTGMSKTRCSQIINALQLQKIVTVTENCNGLTKKYKFNKHFDEWTTVKEKCNGYRKMKKGLQKSVTVGLQKSVTTKENNINKITKENIYSRDAQKILDYLNQKKGSRYTKKDEIIARLKEGHTFEECITIIENKFKDSYFLENPDYLNPVTLFRKSHFDNYLNAGTMKPVKTKNQTVDADDLYQYGKEKGYIKE